MTKKGTFYPQSFLLEVKLRAKTEDYEELVDYIRKYELPKWKLLAEQQTRQNDGVWVDGSKVVRVIKDKKLYQVQTGGAWWMPEKEYRLCLAYFYFGLIKDLKEMQVAVEVNGLVEQKLKTEEVAT